MLTKVGMCSTMLEFVFLMQLHGSTMVNHSSWECTAAVTGPTYIPVFYFREDSIYFFAFFVIKGSHSIYQLTIYTYVAQDHRVDSCMLQLKQLGCR